MSARSGVFNSGGDGERQSPAISFVQRHANSEAFKALFREGMTLVEEAAGYLDGPGRAASKTLRRPAALAYATESMRLTTRLMQIASWLLLRRAVNEGELTPAQAQSERHRVRLARQELSCDETMLAELPPEFADLACARFDFRRACCISTARSPSPRPAPGVAAANPLARRISHASRRRSASPETCAAVFGRKRVLRRAVDGRRSPLPVTPALTAADIAAFAPRLRAALGAGDVASVAAAARHRRRGQARRRAAARNRRRARRSAARRGRTAARRAARRRRRACRGRRRRRGGRELQAASASSARGGSGCATTPWRPARRAPIT